MKQVYPIILISAAEGGYVVHIRAGDEVGLHDSGLLSAKKFLVDISCILSYNSRINSYGV